MLRSSIILFFGIQIIGIVGTLINDDLLLSISYTHQPSVIAWCVGSLLRHISITEHDKAIAEEKAKHRKKQLQMLHVLHDSVANDLVYAAARCRAVRARVTHEDNAEDIEEIIDVLERSLYELRQQVIVPAKNDIAGTSPGMSNDPKTDAGNTIHPRIVPANNASAPAQKLDNAIADVTHRLRKQGFDGVPQIDGDITALSADMIDLTAQCVCELGNNILKHGSPGKYALAVNAGPESVLIVASNMLGSHARPIAPPLTSDSGLALMKRDVRDAGGEMSYGLEDNEWTICVTFPNRIGKEPIGVQPPAEKPGNADESETADPAEQETY